MYVLLAEQFLLCLFSLEGNFQVQIPGAYIWRGDLTEGFLRYEFAGRYVTFTVVQRFSKILNIPLSNIYTLKSFEKSPTNLGSIWRRSLGPPQEGRAV